ncbi:MAG TPA: EamA family transporter [Gemmatimonadales bacterium]
MDGTRRPKTAALIVAFGLIYLVWGSTYWAIKVGLDSMPPFLLGGIRFTLAGAMLLAYTRVARLGPITAAHWKAAAVTGMLMLLLGNGAVILAERRAPTGLVALMVTTVPIWMVLLDWLRPGGRRPGPAVFIGLAAGTLGIVLLVNPAAALGGVGVPPFEALILVVGSVSWAIGSLYSRAGQAPGPATLLAALQMVVAGVAFLLVALLTGEMGGFAASAVTLRTWLAVGYLAVFGSVLAYSAYVWLMRVTQPARVATYAYVNPVVALTIGALLGNERITPRIALATVVLLGAVVTLNRVPPRPRRSREGEKGREGRDGRQGLRAA